MERDTRFNSTYQKPANEMQLIINQPQQEGSTFFIDILKEDMKKNGGYTLGDTVNNSDLGQEINNILANTKLHAQYSKETGLSPLHVKSGKYYIGYIKSLQQDLVKNIVNAIPDYNKQVAFFMKEVNKLLGNFTDQVTNDHVIKFFALLLSDANTKTKTDKIANKKEWWANVVQILFENENKAKQFVESTDLLESESEDFSSFIFEMKSNIHHDIITKHLHILQDPPFAAQGLSVKPQLWFSVIQQYIKNKKPDMTDFNPDEALGSVRFQDFINTHEHAQIRENKISNRIIEANLVIVMTAIIFHYINQKQNNQKQENEKQENVWFGTSNVQMKNQLSEQLLDMIINFKALNVLYFKIPFATNPLTVKNNKNSCFCGGGSSKK